jgi:hypothetical protein
VWEILKEAGIDPVAGRSATTWASFLQSQAEALLACDFFETVTLSGTRVYVLAVIEHHTRRIRVLGATAHPTASWVAQAARNLVMEPQDAGCRARFLIRDRDGKLPELFDAVLADAGLEVVLSCVRMPRMNSIMERWVQACRRELLDRTAAGVPGDRVGAGGGEHDALGSVQRFRPAGASSAVPGGGHETASACKRGLAVSGLRVDLTGLCLSGSSWFCNNAGFCRNGKGCLRKARWQPENGRRPGGDGRVPW